MKYFVIQARLTSKYLKNYVSNNVIIHIFNIQQITSFFEIFSIIIYLVENSELFKLISL